MASNTATTPTPISLDQAERVIFKLGQAQRGSNQPKDNLGILAAAELNDGLIADFTLTSAQLLALNATPVTIMNAPALVPTVGNPTTISTTANVNPGYVVLIDRAIMYYKAGGTAYTINGCTGLSIQINSVEQVRLPVTGVIDQTSDKTAGAGLVSPAAVGPIIAANSAVTVTALTASPTLGTGTVSIRLYYTLCPANF